MPNPTSILLSQNTSPRPEGPGYPVWQSDVAWGAETEPIPVDSLGYGLIRPAESQEKVWGSGSVVSIQVQPKEAVPRIENPSEPWQTSVVIVVVLCFYCFMLYRFRRDILSGLKNMTYTEDTLTLMEEQGADFNRFLWCGTLLAVLSGSALAMNWMEWQLPGVQNYILFGASLLGFGGILVYRWLALRLMQWMTEDRGIYHQIRFINRMDFAFLALFYTPFAIIIGMSGRFFEAGLILLGILLLSHFLALYKYFRLRGFSGMQYFLYLCTIEILPVSFLIALALRYQVG